MEQYKIISSDIHFVNISCNVFDGFINSDKYNSECDDVSDWLFYFNYFLLKLE